MNDPANPGRRKLLLTIVALSTSDLARASLTPTGSEGPFYPSHGMRFDDIDNDLVKVDGAVMQAGGEIVRLTGRVLEHGEPLRKARVEIWQCDVNGRYLHRADSNGQARDPGFQGFGYDMTDESGYYSFRTIKPVPYSGRTPHIHVKVSQAGSEILTTQLYLPDHADNKRDWLYQNIPSSKRDLVTMNFKTGPQEPEAIVDLLI